MCVIFLTILLSYAEFKLHWANIITRFYRTTVIVTSYSCEVICVDKQWRTWRHFYSTNTGNGLLQNCIIHVIKHSRFPISEKFILSLQRNWDDAELLTACICLSWNGKTDKMMRQLYIDISYPVEYMGRQSAKSWRLCILPSPSLSQCVVVCKCLIRI